MEGQYLSNRMRLMSKCILTDELNHDHYCIIIVFDCPVQFLHYGAWLHTNAHYGAVCCNCCTNSDCDAPRSDPTFWMYKLRYKRVSHL